MPIGGPGRDSAFLRRFDDADWHLSRLPHPEETEEVLL